MFHKETNQVSRHKSVITGGLNTCLLTNLIYNEQPFLVQIDTGSSDTALPGYTINNFTGPTVQYNLSDSSEKIFNVYGDGSSWTGGAYLLQIALDDLEGYTSAPIGLITSQSTNPAFINGNSYSGLLGIAYSALANIKSFSPNNIIDTLVQNQVIPKNQVAIHACNSSDYWIDYGNTTPIQSCSNGAATVDSPSLTYYTLNVISTSIAGVAQQLPSNFQCRSRQALGDSCTNFIAMPADLVYNLQSMLINSNGLPNELLSSISFNSWLYELSPTSYTDFKWNLLPNISFTINTGGPNPRNLTITIGPQNYILQNGYGQCKLKS
ncbi:hypothetical protein HDV06_000038 [Boothiomyces sp. JEL0866]|nr:hypothetical protein HDV06_000038 [Boothiomyces sp. JEL0866]